MDNKQKILRKPSWLKIKLPADGQFSEVNKILGKRGIHTICQSGNCPNMGECWGRGTATFMILGDICTRSCKFCAVTTGRPLPPVDSEPESIAEAVKLMNLKHCVLTSVDRDDLPDLGAAHWAKTIATIKSFNPETTIEALVPDFQGRNDLIELVAQAKPEIISHNLETVRRLTSLVRSKAKYETSLMVIKQIAETGTVAKSGIMLGLGETHDEILETMDDLLAHQCSVFTLGQYLQPSFAHLPVEAYITPETFEQYRLIGLEKGFRHVESAPLVRSSYHAETHVA